MTIQVFSPSVGQEELDAVEKVFKSNWLGEGRRTSEFATTFSKYLGVTNGYVQALASCTDGLFLSLESIGVTCGDDVVLPSISFVGAANAICARGATPVFCDVDSRTLNAGVDDVMRAITTHTKAVIVLHYGGVPCDIKDIAEYCRTRKVQLIEDSACSVASRVDGQACGTFGDFGMWSFDAMKILVCGDGGMIYVRNQGVSRKLRKLACFGLSSESGLSSTQTARWWEFEIEEFGRRATMNDISAAIGLEQLKKLPAFIERRKQIYETYMQCLKDQSWLMLPPPIPANAQSSYYFFWIQTGSALRDRLATYLRENGIYTTMRYHPLHTVRAYDHSGRLSGAETAARSTLLLPLHQGLSDEDVSYICEMVRKLPR